MHSAQFHSGDLPNLCKSEVSSEADAVALFGAINPTKLGQSEADN